MVNRVPTATVTTPDERLERARKRARDLAKKAESDSILDIMEGEEEGSYEAPEDGVVGAWSKTHRKSARRGARNSNPNRKNEKVNWGRLVRLIRERGQLRNSDIGEVVGMSKSTPDDWTHGKTIPSGNARVKLVELARDVLTGSDLESVGLSAEPFSFDKENSS